MQKLIPKVKHILRFDTENFAELEHDIKRNRAIGGFDTAHMRSADIDQLRQFALRQAVFLAVERDIQPKRFVVLREFVLHRLTHV